MSKFDLKTFYKYFSKCIAPKTQPRKLDVLLGIDIHESSQTVSRCLSGKENLPQRWIRQVLGEGVEQISLRFDEYMKIDPPLIIEEILIGEIKELSLQENKYQLSTPKSYNSYDTHKYLAYYLVQAMINEALKPRSKRNSDSNTDPMIEEDNITKVYESSASYSMRIITQSFHTEHEHFTTFFKECIDHGEIAEIYMEFHTGWEWGLHSEKIELLNYFHTQKIPIKMLVNPSSAIKNICNNMRSRYTNYGDIDGEIDSWERRTKFYDNIEFKICSIPVFRRYYLVKFKSGEELASAHNYYYMSELNTVKNNKRVLTSNMQEFQTYKSEFEYLWNGTNNGKKISIPYSEFNRIQLAPVPDLDYILIYKSSNDHRKSPYIVSHLQISKNRTATMKTNYLESENRYEYSYNGDVKLSGNTFYLRLNDKYYHETVSIILNRSVPSINRCIGILSGLTPSNQPRSSLCICVPYAEFSKLDFSFIEKVFQMIESHTDRHSIIIMDEIQEYFFSFAL